MCAPIWCKCSAGIYCRSSPLNISTEIFVASKDKVLYCVKAGEGFIGFTVGAEDDESKLAEDIYQEQCLVDIAFAMHS